MTYVVTQPCAVDASCVLACPVNCIQPAPGDPGFADAEMLHIDPATCVGCGACTTACPVGAIVPASDLTVEQQPFAALNADYFVEHPHDDRLPLAPVVAPVPLRRRGVRVAVVGAGPAGLFTADELLRHPGVGVDVLERLEQPHGLARYGVAPDHRSTRSVSDLFAAIEATPGFGYRLGVEVGRDVTHDQLTREYDAVVYAVGAPVAQRLGVPGEDLPGSVTAGDLARWYNGHPDLAGLHVPLDTERAVVVGNGNVALDVARVLLAGPARVVDMDVSPDVAARLRASAVREVVVLGRRGPAEAAFTVPELLGITALVRSGGLRVAVDLGERRWTGDDRRTRLLSELTRSPGDPGAPRLVLAFHTAARRVLGEDRVSGLEVEREGQVRVVDAGLVVTSIGFHVAPVPGLPYDEATGTVPHDRGRVAAGTYVVGWAKRGPRGFIGTNRTDARETVAQVLRDLDAPVSSGPAHQGAEPRHEQRRGRQRRLVRR